MHAHASSHSSRATTSRKALAWPEAAVAMDTACLARVGNRPLWMNPVFRKSACDVIAERGKGERQHVGSQLCRGDSRDLYHPMMSCVRTGRGEWAAGRGWHFSEKHGWAHRHGKLGDINFYHFNRAAVAFQPWAHHRRNHSDHSSENIVSVEKAAIESDYNDLIVPFKPK